MEVASSKSLVGNGKLIAGGDRTLRSHLVVSPETREGAEIRLLASARGQRRERPTSRKRPTTRESTRPV